MHVGCSVYCCPHRCKVSSFVPCTVSDAIKVTAQAQGGAVTQALKQGPRAGPGICRLRSAGAGRVGRLSG